MARLSAELLPPPRATVRFRVDGVDVEVDDRGLTLLEVLRDDLGIRSVKDGCSPQGQCGCCTVWVDDSPRVSCVTPVRRLAGRVVTTLGGLPEERSKRWSMALAATGGSQCGFCTPGIIMRLAALEPPADASSGTTAGPTVELEKVRRALAAHLCRCTGWQTIEEAAMRVLDPSDQLVDLPRDLHAAGRRASLEGGSIQRVGPGIALGDGGFADDSAPPEALAAVPDATGEYVTAETATAARRLAAKVPGRRVPTVPRHPVELPPGEWALTLKTTWVEPAYLEPDASWCAPGETPKSWCANGGAFGGKRRSPVGSTARRLADERGRPVRVLWSREDVVRLGSKRPPVAVGMGGDGSGVLRIGVSGTPWSGAELEAVCAMVGGVAPGLVVEPVPIVGPAVSLDLRAAVWAEAAVVDAVRRAKGQPMSHGPIHDVPVEVVAPSGGRAVATCRTDGSLAVSVWGGQVLDEVVLRSYVIGAAHQALGWVTSEGLAVDEEGTVGDLTIRSFGILTARAMPQMEVTIVDQPGRAPVNASDAAFAAVAAARWLAGGLVAAWPTGIGADPAHSPERPVILPERPMNLPERPMKESQQDEHADRPL